MLSVIIHSGIGQRAEPPDQGVRFPVWGAFPRKDIKDEVGDLEKFWRFFEIPIYTTLLKLWEKLPIGALCLGF